MAVYVDDMRRYGQIGTTRSHWSHLLADSSDELHDFAAHLGLKREWCQAEGTRREHYDVSDTKRLQAIDEGAQPISYPRETGELIMRRKLDVIAEPDRRRAEHMNRTMRLAEGGGEL